MDIFSIMLWGVVVLYALSSLAFIFGSLFHKERIVSVGFILTCLGMVVHIVAIAMRWIEIGYGPYIGFFDAVSSYAVLAVAVYVALVIWRRSLVAVGVIVMPLAFMFLGVAMMTSPTDMGITPALASVWLVAHVVFAATAVTAMVIAFALAAVYVLRERGKDIKVFDQLPSQGLLDITIFRFVSVGFILWTIMIIIGAVWANEAWGRYWGWDPIETWSLIAWLVYAVVLHLRLTRGWSGTRFAYLALGALPLMLFALIGVPFVWDSIHAAYLAVE